MTVATLGFTIDSSDMTQAVTELDRLSSSAARAEQAANRSGTAGSKMAKAYGDISPMLERITLAAERTSQSTLLIDKRLAAIVKATTEAAKANAVLDRSAVEASGAYKELEASLNGVLAAQRKSDAGMASSLSMIEKQRESIAKLNAELQKLRSAPPVPGGNNPVPANSNDMARRTVLGYQGFDIGQGLASGMPAQMILAQQGPQIAQMYAGQGGIKALVGDITTMAGAAAAAIGGLPLALGAAGVAAATYFAFTKSATKSTDEILDQHRKNIAALGDAYGIAEEKARSFSAADKAVASATTQKSYQDLGKRQVEDAKDFRLNFGSMQTPGRSGGTFFGLQPNYQPFKEAFDQLDQGIRKGQIDGESFIDTVAKISKISPEYDKFGKKILEAAGAFLDVNNELKKTQDLLFQTSRLPPLDPLGTFNTQRRADEIAARTPSQFEQLQNRRNAFRQQLNARSPAEQEAAARATADAQYTPGENDYDRKNRIDTAGMQARLTAEKQLADAQRDRALNLNKFLDDQHIELDLIGKTGGAAAALRKEYELTSALRLEAARNGTEVDQAELLLIKEKVKALAALGDQYEQTAFAASFNIDSEGTP